MSVFRSVLTLALALLAVAACDTRRGATPSDDDDSAPTDDDDAIDDDDAADDDDATDDDDAAPANALVFNQLPPGLDIPPLSAFFVYEVGEEVTKQVVAGEGITCAAFQTWSTELAELAALNLDPELFQQSRDGLFKDHFDAGWHGAFNVVTDGPLVPGPISQANMRLDQFFDIGAGSAPYQIADFLTSSSVLSGAVDGVGQTVEGWAQLQGNWFDSNIGANQNLTFFISYNLPVCDI